MRKLTLGKIYKNGIQYSGTTDAATNINYDNSKGAIRAGNVQGAIDEIMETTSQSRTLTQAEYDALPDTKYTDGIEYFITDAEPLDASTIAYDNTASKMTATNVQAGIDELNSNLGGMKFGIDSNGNYGYIKAGADSVTPFSSNKRYSYSWTSSNNEQKTLTLEIEPKYIAFTVGGIKTNAVLYDVENQEYIINAAGVNIITSVNGKVVTINTYHGSTAVNYLNYW